MALDVLDIAIAKKYTKETAAGGGAIKGDKGDKGERGEKGDKGDKGETGQQGVQGVPGAKGDTGERGEKGDPFTYDDFTPEQLAALKGDKGEKGDTGQQGIQGIQGEKGEQGIQGIQGLQGVQGIKGDKGDDGYPFLIYKQYDTLTEYDAGDFPEIGLLFLVMEREEKGLPVYRHTGEGVGYTLITHMNTEGIKGERGERGEQGEQGVPGIQGEQGETGPQGLQGEQGEAGKDGKSAYEIAKEHGFTGTEEEWAALFNMLTDKGNGDKYLNNKGEYKEIKLECIVDVDALPAENIDDSKIYRLKLEPGWYWTDTGEKLTSSADNYRTDFARKGYNWYWSIPNASFNNGQKFTETGYRTYTYDTLKNDKSLGASLSEWAVLMTSGSVAYPFAPAYLLTGQAAVGMTVGNQYKAVKSFNLVYEIKKNTVKLYHHFNGEWLEIGQGTGETKALVTRTVAEATNDTILAIDEMTEAEVAGLFPKATTEQYGLVKHRISQTNITDLWTTRDAGSCIVYIRDNIGIISFNGMRFTDTSTTTTSREITLPNELQGVSGFYGVSVVTTGGEVSGALSMNGGNRLVVRIYGEKAGLYGSLAFPLKNTI